VVVVVVVVVLAGKTDYSAEDNFKRKKVAKPTKEGKADSGKLN